MYDLPDMDSLRAVLDQPLAPQLHKLLADRLSDTLHCGLEDYTHVLVIEEGDDEDAVIAAIGFSPLRSRIDDVSNLPDWDWIEHHEGWIEALYCVGNSGFAYTLLVEAVAGSAFADFYQRQRPCA